MPLMRSAECRATWWAISAGVHAGPSEPRKRQITPDRRRRTVSKHTRERVLVVGDLHDAGEDKDGTVGEHKGAEGRRECQHRVQRASTAKRSKQHALLGPVVLDDVRLPTLLGPSELVLEPVGADDALDDLLDVPRLRVPVGEDPPAVLAHDLLQALGAHLPLQVGRDVHEAPAARLGDLLEVEDVVGSPSRDEDEEDGGACPGPQGNAVGDARSQRPVLARLPRRREEERTQVRLEVVPAGPPSSGPSSSSAESAPSASPSTAACRGPQQLEDLSRVGWLDGACGGGRVGLVLVRRRGGAGRVAEAAVRGPRAAIGAQWSSRGRHCSGGRCSYSAEGGREPSGAADRR